MSPLQQEGSPARRRLLVENADALLLPYFDLGAFVRDYELDYSNGLSSGGVNEEAKSQQEDEHP